MDNRHCLSYTIGKKDEMERMYLLVKIRSCVKHLKLLNCFAVKTCLVSSENAA